MQDTTNQKKISKYKKANHLKKKKKKKNYICLRLLIKLMDCPQMEKLSYYNMHYCWVMTNNLKNLLLYR